MQGQIGEGGEPQLGRFDLAVLVHEERTAVEVEEQPDVDHVRAPVRVGALSFPGT